MNRENELLSDIRSALEEAKEDNDFVRASEQKRFNKNQNRDPLKKALDLRDIEHLKNNVNRIEKLINQVDLLAGVTKA